jgi:hypothetical protein
MGDIYPGIDPVPVALAPRRQYTLLGMLSYMIAVAVYSSMMASLRPLFAWDEYSHSMWPVFVTIPTAWCVLWWLYRKWHLPQALRVHYVGPVIALVPIAIGAFTAVVSLLRPTDTYLSELGNLMAGGAMITLYACGVSAAVSLPSATVMLLYLMLRPASDKSP